MYTFTRTITLGFTPKFVIISGDGMFQSYLSSPGINIGGGFAITGAGAGAMSDYYGGGYAIEIVQNGFKLKGPSLNRVDVRYLYAAYKQ